MLHLKERTIEANILTIDELNDVCGGGYHFEGKAVVEMITSNRSSYSSGKEPRYCVGQKLKIMYYINVVGSDFFECDCEVLSVSGSAHCGLFCKEFGYMVQILSAPAEVLLYEDVVGNVYVNVYESCLHTN